MPSCGDLELPDGRPHADSPVWEPEMPDARKPLELPMRERPRGVAVSDAGAPPVLPLVAGAEAGIGQDPCDLVDRVGGPLVVGVALGPKNLGQFAQGILGGPHPLG